MQLSSPLAAEPPPQTICRLCLITIKFNSLEQWSSSACSKQSFQVQVNHFVGILCRQSRQKLQCLQQSQKVCEVCKLRCLKYQNSKDVKEIVLWSDYDVTCLYQLRVQPNLILCIFPYCSYQWFLEASLCMGFFLYVTIKLFLYARLQALHFF